MFIATHPSDEDSGFLGELTLLYVEDEEAVRGLLAQFLSRRVGTLLTAGNGREGLELFREHRPDLVITDILMPEMNGLAMIEAIRQIDPQVPVIIATAFNEADYLLKAINLGIDAFVVKPVKLNQLHAQLDKCARVRKLENALRESNAILRNILACLDEAVFVVDPASDRILDCNATAERLFGYEREEILGSASSALLPGEDASGRFDDMRRRAAQLPMRRKNGESFPGECLIEAIHNPKGKATYIVHVIRDITQQKRAESILAENQRRLQFMAHHDSLTGLSNRLLLEERLNHFLSRAKRQQLKLAVLFLDLDGFKSVNDRWGHEIGDQLLMAVVDRLRKTVRAQDTLARFGGDEFVLLLEDLPESKGAAEVAHKVIQTISVPFQIGEQRLQVGVSIGISLFPSDGDHAEILIHRADQAMYRAKRQGGNRYRFCFAEDGNPDSPTAESSA